MTGPFESLANRAVKFGQQVSPSDVKRGAELIVGPYRSGKTTLLIDELIDFCRVNPFASALVVVPSARYRTLFEKRLHDRLKARGIKGIVGLQILPFYKTCEQVLRKSGFAFQLVPEHVRASLISRVLTHLAAEKKIQAIEPIIGFAGTHSSLLELIDELQRAALLPEEVLAKLEETAQSEARFMDLARVYQRYCDELSELQYLDERGIAFAARSLLSRDDCAFKTGFVAADGFDRFNHLQLQVLQGLFKHAERSRVCFDYVLPEQDAALEYSWKDNSYAELTTTLRSAHQRWVVNERTEVLPIEMGKTLDRFFEAQESARAIKQLILDGTKAGQILVVARSISAYAPAIHAAFDGAGVSYFLDESAQLQALPVVQFMSRLLELSTVRSFKRSEVIAVLRSPYLRPASVIENEKDLLRLDRLSLEQKVVEHRQQWTDMLTGLKDKFSSEFGKAFNDFVTALQPPASGTLRDYIVWAEDLFDRYLVLSNDSADDQFQRWEEHKAVGEFRGCLADLLQEENICGAVNCTPEFFFSRLNHLSEKSNFRRSPRHSEYVTICGADLAPNRSYEHVFILGLAEGEFPQKARQTGFLSADEIARWHSFGVDLRNPRFHPGFELALFRSLVQRARLQVNLTHPLFESNGEELMPSYFMTGGDESARVRNIVPFQMARTKPISARDAVSAMLWHKPLAHIEDARAMLPLTTLVEALSEPLYLSRGRADGLLAGHFQGDLREIVGTGLLRLPIPAQWSASRLNEYGKCPFRYWMTHVLRVKPQEEPEAGLDVMVLGETYHKALELFYSSLIARRLRLVSMQWEDAARLFQSATNAALALLEQRADVRRGEFWRYERNEIMFRLKRFFMKEFQRAQVDKDEFIPVMTEAGFGMHDGQSHPAVKIRRGDKEIIVRGRIDRIDVSAPTIDSASPRVRVIDYKSGSSAISKEDAVSGRNIQLPLYALAVQQSIMPGAGVVSGQYLSVSSGEPSGRLSFGSESRREDGEVDVLDAVRKHVGNFVAAIETGEFTVRPSHQSVCKRCDHRSVCRVAEMPDNGQQPVRQEEK